MINMHRLLLRIQYLFVRLCSIFIVSHGLIFICYVLFCSGNNLNPFCNVLRDAPGSNFSCSADRNFKARCNLRTYNIDLDAENQVYYNYSLQHNKIGDGSGNFFERSSDYCHDILKMISHCTLPHKSAIIFFAVFQLWT